MDDKKIELLANEEPSKAILKLSIPMIMGMMVQVLYNLVDTYFIGLLNDANQLAAANMALPIFIIQMGIASIIGTGAASYISRCLGKKNYEEANKTTSISVILLGVIAVLATIFGVIFCKSLVSALGAEGATFDYTYQYVVIMLIGSIGVIGNFAFGQLLRAEGNAMRSMMGMVIGTILNIILDPIFIFVFDLGVAGAALATVIGNFIGFLYYVICFIKGKTLIKIKAKYFKFDKVVYSEIFKIGLPSSLSQILMGGANIIGNNIGMTYGTATVAGMGVAMKIIMIGTFIFIGFSSGVQPLIGYNYGSENFKRVKDIINSAIRMTTVVGIVLLFILGFISPYLIDIFTNDVEVIEKGTIILRALLLSLPFVGGQMIGTGTAQSTGKAMAAMVLSISRQGILYVPIVLILNSLFGFYGFILAQPITDMIMRIVTAIYVKYAIKVEEIPITTV